LEVHPGADRPSGVPGDLLGDDLDPKSRLVSFQTCGGTLFGSVSRSDLLGHAQIGVGGGRCPDTRSEDPPVQYRVSGDLLTCSRAMPAFLQTVTLRDPIGVLKAAARLRVDGEAEGGMQLVTVADAPVLPFAFAHFAVRNSDLASCSSL
jgi:hypothetical protein